MMLSTLTIKHCDESRLLLNLQTKAAPQKCTITTVQKTFPKNNYLCQLLEIICTYGKSSESHVASLMGPSGLVATQG